MIPIPKAWPPDAPVIRCANDHPVTYWSRFVIGTPGRLTWFVRLSPHWEPVAGIWRRGKRSKRWRLVKMPPELQRDEAPAGAIGDNDGIHLPPPVRLRCPHCMLIAESGYMP